jgi:hypothetical protein
LDLKPLYFGISLLAQGLEVGTVRLQAEPRLLAGSACELPRTANLFQSLQLALDRYDFDAALALLAEAPPAPV